MTWHDQTRYIIEEIKHLDWCGMTAYEIAQALGRPMKTLSKLLYRHNLPELAVKFARVPFKELA